MSLKEITKLVQRMEQANEPHTKFLLELEKTICLQDSLNCRMPSQSFKPSSIGGCSRNIYYQLIGEKPISNSSANGIGICESGTDRHERLQNAIMKIDGCTWLDIEMHLKTKPHLNTSVVEKCGNETKCFNQDYNMRFLCDGLILFNNRKYIIEIKTETSMKWNKRFDVDPKHLLQAACYSLCLGIDEVIFIYEDRDLCRKKAFYVEVSDELKMKVIDQISEVMEHLENETLPEKSTNKRDCTYCNYKEICKRG